MNDVLVVGTTTDPLCDGVLDCAARHSVEFGLLDTTPGQSNLSLSSEGGAINRVRCNLSGRNIALNDVRGIFLRPPLADPQSDLGDDTVYALGELTSVTRFLSYKARCKVINRLHHELWALPSIEGHVLARLLDDANIRHPEFVLSSGSSTEEVHGAFDGVDLCYTPFSSSRESFPIPSRGENASQVAAWATSLPLRVAPTRSDPTERVLVVGPEGLLSPGNATTAADRARIVEASVSICSGLGIALASIEWVLPANSPPACLSLNPRPYPFDRGEVAWASEAILQELLR